VAGISVHCQLTRAPGRVCHRDDRAWQSSARRYPVVLALRASPLPFRFHCPVSGHFHPSGIAGVQSPVAMHMGVLPGFFQGASLPPLSRPHSAQCRVRKGEGGYSTGNSGKQAIAGLMCAFLAPLYAKSVEPAITNFFEESAHSLLTPECSSCKYIVYTLYGHYVCN